MGNIRTHVMLSAELLKQLDEVVGKRKRSEFIEEAVERALRQRRQLEAFEAALAVEGPHVPEWDDPDRWLQELRRPRRDKWAEAADSED